MGLKYTIGKTSDIYNPVTLRRQQRTRHNKCSKPKRLDCGGLAAYRIALHVPPFLLS